LLSLAFEKAPEINLLPSLSLFRRRSNGRGFRRQNNDNEGRRLISGAFSNARDNNNFKPHQSVERLLERYKLLAKEALSSGDRTLSENYLQHVDHFERIISQKKSNQNGNNSQVGNINKEQNNNLSTDSTINQGSVTKNEE
jgi:vacuolar-type H+-ATPase subunit B/Vma2